MVEYDNELVKTKIEEVKNRCKELKQKLKDLNECEKILESIKMREDVQINMDDRTKNRITFIEPIDPQFGTTMDHARRQAIFDDVMLKTDALLKS